MSIRNIAAIINPLSSRTSSPGRAPTPSSNIRRQRSIFPEHIDDLQSRSRSRARPNKTHGADASHQTRRFESPANNADPPIATPVPASVKTAQWDRENDYQYSKDEPGEEMSDQARIWRIYNNEAARADASLTDGCNRSIDVLLVFTGLFSAVLTTFIIQSYQLMIPDAADTTNALLAQLIVLQSPSTIPISLPNSSTSSRQIHWVNGLWFAALSFSLSTALVAMLSKQWLQAYLPNVSGSARHRARQRQSRYMRLEAWYVLAMINALPMLLHVALLLFFAGLIVLLWSVDIGITLVTWVVVALAYIFYVTSIWLSLTYPDCPYQHPITEHLRRWFVRNTSVSGRPHSFSSSRYKKGDVEKNIQEPKDTSDTKPTSAASPDDELDAAVLIWLFTRSTDEAIVSAALQAIAGLRRDFSALHILREAGALFLIEQKFQACFHRATVDLQWRLIDPEGAELYCRAWMTLTRGTSEQWPLEIIEPLWILQEFGKHPDAAAIASCAVALSSFDSHISQWELLSQLAKFATGEVLLNHTTQCWLLDSVVECIVRWEMPKVVIEETVIRAVPVLIRLLDVIEDLPTTNVRSTVALALFAVTGGTVNLLAYNSEERRREDYCQLMVHALSAIVENPTSFGIKDALLDIAAQELVRLAPPIVVRSERFPHSSRDVAKSSFSKLYIDGRVGVGIVPDNVLADVLHLMFPPTNISPQQKPILVAALVETLWISSQSDITSWSIRLLEILLYKCPLSVSQAFTDKNGMNAVLRAAKAGDVDSRRLQIDSLRTLCTFIHSSALLYFDQLTPPSAHSKDPFDAVFQSSFFETLCSVVTSRRWWLFEVSGHWMPALVCLCRIRPQEDIWQTVVTVFRDFADRNMGEQGYTETLAHLDAIAQLSKGKVE